jgi:hypothetical protein
MALRDPVLILVGFDRASIPMHAGKRTREGLGHSGVILYRRWVSRVELHLPPCTAFRDTLLLSRPTVLPSTGGFALIGECVVRGSLLGGQL